MRHGKYFKLVHLSCWDMGRDWDFFMLIGKKKQRNKAKEEKETVESTHTKKKSGVERKEKMEIEWKQGKRDKEERSK